MGREALQGERCSAQGEGQRQGQTACAAAAAAAPPLCGDPRPRPQCTHRWRRRWRGRPAGRWQRPRRSSPSRQTEPGPPPAVPAIAWPPRAPATWSARSSCGTRQRDTLLVPTRPRASVRWLPSRPGTAMAAGAAAAPRRASPHPAAHLGGLGIPARGGEQGTLRVCCWRVGLRSRVPDGRRQSGILPRAGRFLGRDACTCSHSVQLACCCHAAKHAKPLPRAPCTGQQAGTAAVERPAADPQLTAGCWSWACDSLPACWEDAVPPPRPPAEAPRA